MKKLYFLTLIALLFTGVKAQELYDLNTIQTIEISFAQSNWDALLDAEKAGNDGYIMAQSVAINGEVFDSVGVKYKGNSTYNRNNRKNPFHIELDTYKEQDYDGYSDIKLSNGANDPSFIREVLSYEILRKYMDAPLSNFANVYVNGSLIGLYANSEAVTKTFAKSHFGSKKNTFIKCNPPDGAGPNTTNLPNLLHLGTDSSNYYSAYEIKSDDGWDELIHLCDTLNNDFDAIEEILDVDRALWMLAFDNALVNLDSYLGAFSQNYYLYRDDNGRFIPVVWDLNESFGRFAQTGSINLNSTSSKQRLSHLLHESDAKFPLVRKLLSNPMYKRMYLAHLKTMMLENFDNNSYYTSGSSMQSTIDASVQADGNKFFTYSNFKSNLTSDISSGMGGPGSSSTPGIKNLMSTRSTYLLALSDFQNEAPTISQIQLSEENPIIGSSVTISATISNPSAAYLGYRSDDELPFTRIQMYDDGTHGDKTANNGIYSTSITVDDSFMQYYIYAENTNAGMFSPQRAEHEFHSFSATVNDLPVGDVVINEFMSSNESTIADQDEEYNDWIELYNNTSSTIDLSGYFLSDDEDDLEQWEFPAGTTIAGGAYLIVWADKDEEQTGLHANFKLSSVSGSIFLSDAAASPVDEVSYTTQRTDISYGRNPNGTGSFEETSPTFNASNSGTSSIDDQELDNSILVYPNPTSNYFNLDIQGSSTENNVIIYSSIGQVVYHETISQETKIDISSWTNGIYIVKAGSSTLRLVVQK